MLDEKSQRHVLVTRTGRFREQEPNPQYLPGSISDKLQKAERERVARRGELPDVDYSEIEKRVMSHLIEDASKAEEIYGADELERLAAEERAKK